MPAGPHPLSNYIDGRWSDGAGALLLDSSPSTPDRVVAQGRSATPEDVDVAVSAAGRAGTSWKRTPAHERSAVLLRAADVVDAHASQWGAELADEEGKTRSEGVGEVERAARILRYCAGAADRAEGEVYHSPRSGERILVTRKPVGVVAVITPFNFPIAIPAWKIAPALTYGNTVVWKPAETVPVLAMRLAEALHEAGLPKGVLNLLVGDSTVGRHLVEHDGVDAITFTGSTSVGRTIASHAAARGVPVQAEMGGKNAAVVLGDADLEIAAEQIALGAFRSAGQKCTATSRLVVVRDIADELLDAITTRTEALTVGDPLADGTDMGPVISSSARANITDAVREALSDKGTTLMTGGIEYQDALRASGHFVAPTIVEVDSRGAPLWHREVFGPVLTVRRTDSSQDAFRIAGEGDFGLSAAVFTQDLTRALDAVDSVNVGVLHINSESTGADPHVPFGGAKKSGYGPMEQGQASAEFFTHSTTVYLRGGRART